MIIEIQPVYRGILKRPKGNNYNTSIREPRIGTMLHYDDGSSDAGGVAWFLHPDCAVSYNQLVLDDGSYYNIAPINARAWHAGSCRPSSSKLAYKDANSAFVGIAATTNSQTPVTQRQLLTIAGLVRYSFDTYNWSYHDLWRITGHADEAWPRGRRRDPYGYDRDHPILDPKAVRELLPFVRIT